MTARTEDIALLRRMAGEKREKARLSGGLSAPILRYCADSLDVAADAIAALGDGVVDRDAEFDRIMAMSDDEIMASATPDELRAARRMQVAIRAALSGETP